MTIQEDINNYKSYCKVLGYMSKISAYDKIYKNVQHDLEQFRNSIINRHVNNIEFEDIKKLAIPIDNNKWYKQGIYNFTVIRNTLIQSYIHKIENILISEEINENTDIKEKNNLSENILKKIEFYILSILSIDIFYEIYDDTIGTLTDKYPVFKEIMYTDFCHHLML